MVSVFWREVLRHNDFSDAYRVQHTLLKGILRARRCSWNDNRT